MVLTRNGQSLAAMQYQGRLLNVWNEIIYDGYGYRLSHVRDQGGSERCVLVDESGDECLSVVSGRARQIELYCPLPLPLLVMVAMRVLDEDESISTMAAVETIPSEKVDKS